VLKIITNDTINLMFNLKVAFCYLQTIILYECSLIKLLPYILFEKYIYILELKMACPGNQHCANCVGSSVLFFLKERVRFCAFHFSVRVRSISSTELPRAIIIYWPRSRSKLY